MFVFFDAWEEFWGWLPAVLALANFVIIAATLTWILMTKTDATSAVAWCLVVVFLQSFGALAFVLFGYQHVNRPLKRKRRHKQQYHQYHLSAGSWPVEQGPGIGSATQPGKSASQALEDLADLVGAFPLTFGNHVDFYYSGPPAIDAMLEAIGNAKHHIHLEFFIFQPDALGKKILGLLTAKAREGVQVRLLYDAMGSHTLPSSLLRKLLDVGGFTSVFLPLNLFRRRFQVNMRNHRKILVVDGTIGFVGGLNIGDEYLGLDPTLGYWRDTHLRLRGPAVTHLQRVFAEDWDFAAGERLSDGPQASVGASYFRSESNQGNFPVQIIDSGPDRDLKSIREMYFAAILQARKRVWIASPYFVPDTALLDAMRLAAYLGVDVRILGQFIPDRWVPQFAARYYWAEVLPAGVKVYQYTRGMMHAKVVIVDDEWASVGTANMDNRSLHLNFEVNCMLYSAEAVAQLASSFEDDLRHSILLEPRVFANRPLPGRLLENACRLLSPVL